MWIDYDEISADLLADLDRAVRRSLKLGFEQNRARIKATAAVRSARRALDAHKNDSPIFVEKKSLPYRYYPDGSHTPRGTALAHFETSASAAEFYSKSRHSCLSLPSWVTYRVVAGRLYSFCMRPPSTADRRKAPLPLP